MSEVAAVESRRRERGSVAEYAARNPALVCLVILVAISGIALVAMGSHLILYGDDWDVVLGRRGWDAGSLLDPHHAHLIVGLVVIYKLLLAGFGMDSPVPYHVVSTLFYLLAAVLLFAYVRRRVGDWLALFATSVILFFGAGAVDMLSSFQMFFSGSIAAGIGSQLALDRDDRRGDLIACALLVVAMSFSEVGLAFSVGALVSIALSRRPLAGRLFVVLVPLVLYAIWWLGWGRSASSELTLHAVATAPAYVLDAVAAAVGALLGLTSSSDQTPEPVGQEWAPILLVAVVGLAAWRVRRLGRVPSGVWPVLAIGLTFWGLAAINANVLRGPGNGRYIYPGAVFVLLIASELMRGVRPRTVAIVAVAAVTAVSLGANLAFLSDSYKQFWLPATHVAKADLRALEIAGPSNPSYVLTEDFFNIPAGSYLTAADAWGSPAYTDAQLLARPEGDRAGADKVLGAMLGLRLEPVAGGSVSCRSVRASQGGATAIELGPGTVILRARSGSAASAAVGRFADGTPVTVGSLAPGSSASFTIPADDSKRPWHLGLVGHGRVAVCRV